MPIKQRARDPAWVCSCGVVHPGAVSWCPRCDASGPASLLGVLWDERAVGTSTGEGADRSGSWNSRRRGLGVAVVVALLAAVAGAGWVGARGAATGRGGRREPGTDVADAGRLGPDPAVAKLAGFVERARGLPFLHPVTVTRVDGATLRARMGSGGILDLADAHPPAATLRALGLVGRASDRAAAPNGPSGDPVGYYDISSKTVYVGQDIPAPFRRFVLVHELTHALQDQHFDLSRSYGDNADAVLAAISLVEGDAERVARAYLGTLAPNRIDDVQQEALTARDELYRGIYNVSAEEFPYAAGEAFARALMDGGGQPRLDAAFLSFPVSTEQILHPDRYLSGDQPLPVPEPVAGGAVLERGVLGEFDLVSVLLGGGIEVSTASRAGEGWGGARYVTWLSSGRACARVRIVMDTPADTARLTAALQQWVARHQGDASLQGGGPLVLTACERA